MNTTYSAPDPATRLSNRDRKLLGLPKDPTQPTTRLVWNRGNLAATFAVTVLVTAFVTWGMLIITQADTSGPIEGPTNTVYNHDTGTITYEEVI